MKGQTTRKHFTMTYVRYDYVKKALGDTETAQNVSEIFENAFRVLIKSV